MSEELVWFAGVDWASERHAACLLDSNGAVVAEGEFDHTGEGLGELVRWLQVHTEAEPAQVAVAIEVPHGAVVETLLAAGFAVFSINPKQSDRFRDRYSMPGAKDDRFDAKVIASAVRTDRALLRRLTPDADAIVELREWSRIHDELKGQRSGLISRFDGQLLRYYPAFRTLCKNYLGVSWTLDLWELAPTPKLAKKSQGKTYQALLKKHRVRRITGADARDALTARPLKVQAATVEAARVHIAMLVAQLRLLNTQLKEADRAIAACLDKLSAPASDGESPGQEGEHSDVEILLSLPGVGRIVAATVLAEASLALRERDYHALRSLSGVAPVTRASGGSRRVVMRQACSSRLRNAVYHWARVAMQHDHLSRARYASLRARGKSHGRALRTVADRLLSVLCAMLRRHETFDAKRAPRISVKAA